MSLLSLLLAGVQNNLSSTTPLVALPLFTLDVAWGTEFAGLSSPSLPWRTGFPPKERLQYPSLPPFHCVTLPSTLAQLLFFPLFKNEHKKLSHSLNEELLTRNPTRCFDKRSSVCHVVLGAHIFVGEHFFVVFLF